MDALVLEQKVMDELSVIAQKHEECIADEACERVASFSCGGTCAGKCGHGPW